jgi:hypothetical protein
MPQAVNAFADMMVQTIQWERRTGTDEYGAPLYGASTTLTCRVVDKERMTRNTAGQEMVSTVTIYILGAPGIEMEDRITLDDGRQPPIIAVRTFPDETGPHHQEVLM